MPDVISSFSAQYVDLAALKRLLKAKFGTAYEWKIGSDSIEVKATRALTQEEIDSVTSHE